MDEQTNVQQTEGTQQESVFLDGNPYDDGNPVEVVGKTLYPLEEIPPDGDAFYNTEPADEGQPPEEAEQSQEEPTSEDMPDWIDPSKPTLTDPKEAALHWKKRHQDSQQYIEQLTEQVKAFEGLTPEYVENLRVVETVLKNNPDILNMLYERTTGPQNGNQSVPQQAQSMPQPPEFFDPAEMFDPSTPSGQWYAQVQQAKEQELLQKFSKVLEEREQQRMLAEQARQRQQQLQSFYEQNKIDDTTRREFEQFLENGPGRELTYEDKFKFFQLLKGMPTSDNGNGSSLNEKIVQVQRNNQIRNPSQMSVQPQPEKSEEQAFVDGLIGQSKKRWTIG